MVRYSISNIFFWVNKNLTLNFVLSTTVVVVLFLTLLIMSVFIVLIKREPIIIVSIASEHFYSIFMNANHYECNPNFWMINNLNSPLFDALSDKRWWELIVLILGNRRNVNRQKHGCIFNTNLLFLIFFLLNLPDFFKNLLSQNCSWSQLVRHSLY